MLISLIINAALLSVLIYAVTGQSEQFGMLVLLILGVSLAGVPVYLLLGGLGSELTALVIEAGLLLVALMWFYGLVFQQAALITGLFVGIKLAIAIVLGFLLASVEPEAIRPVEVPPGAIACHTSSESPPVLDSVVFGRRGQEGSWTCCSTSCWCFC